MDIITYKDLNKTNIPLKKHNKVLLKWIMKGAKINRLNSLYKEQYSNNPDEFITNILEELNIKSEYIEQELANIPKSGPFIAYANHPLGILDGLIFINLIRKKRKDIKILANDLLSRVEPLSELLISVDLSEKNQSSSKNVSGVKQMYSHLKNDGGILVFPAGEVSTMHNGKIQDKIWKKSVVKMMVKPKVPLIPIYFAGNNSITFHIKGKIHESWRTLSLINEMYNKQNFSIPLRIGKQIIPEKIIGIDGIDKKRKYLRAKIYGLSNPRKQSNRTPKLKKLIRQINDVVEHTSTEALVKEVFNLPNKSRIINSRNFHIYITTQKESPHIVREICRLREITFREVGEGSGKKIDMDKYDAYYQHLFIWDSKAHRIVGSYRVGFGKDIIERYGKTGFYSNSLFKYNNEFIETLERSIELGRSFIEKNYQKHPLVLLLLWKGILEILIKNPNYRYLLGPVSISNNFSSISKEIIIMFLKRKYYNYDQAKYVKARKPYKIKHSDISKTLLDIDAAHLKDLDKLIQDIEPCNLKTPVLLKKYMNQNAKIIGFNTDPKFNNCLDGLILLDFAWLPQNTIQRFSHEDPYNLLQRQNAFYYENAIQF